MSIYQPIKMPVRVFSSEDTDAPHLTPTGGVGEVKTILKACLITGYGSTTAQDGWTMPFEDGNKAVFKSKDPRETGGFYRIDNANVTNFTLSAYKSMTDIDTGEDAWSNAALAHVYSSNYPSPAQWRLFATDLSVFFICTNYEKLGDVYNAWYYFGKYMSNQLVESGDAIIWGTRNQNSYGSVNRFPFASSATVVADLQMSGTQTAPSHVSKLLTNGAEHYADNPTATGEVAHPAYLCEKIGNANFVRGAYPFFISEKKEVRKANNLFTESNLAQRTVIETTIGWESNGEGGYKLMIPTDSWEY